MIGTDKAVSSGNASRLCHLESARAVIVPVTVDRIATGSAIARLFDREFQNSGVSASCAYQSSVRPLIGKLTIAAELKENRTTRTSGPSMKPAKSASTSVQVNSDARVIGVASG